MSEQNQGTKLERIKIIWWYLVYRNLQTHEMGSHHSKKCIVSLKILQR